MITNNFIPSTYTSEDTMRSMLAMLCGIVCVFLVIGCADQSVPVDVAVHTDGGPTSINAQSFIPSTSLNKTKVKLLKQPLPISASTGASGTASITPSKGGKVSIDYSYTSATGPVRIKASLTFPKDAVTIPTTVTMTIHPVDVLAELEFTPSPSSFLKPAILDFAGTGLDLTGYTEANMKFFYLIDGIYQEAITMKKIKLDVAKGKLNVDGLEIWHFSRYAFGRVEEDGGE